MHFFVRNATICAYILENVYSLRMDDLHSISDFAAFYFQNLGGDL